MVALEKDPGGDPNKLHPLGVPSAIWRIAAIAVLSEYSSVFAQHLLPYNFAVGVGGGCDVVIKTMQLGVDKYISEPEAEEKLPSRALVSLDIINCLTPYFVKTYAQLLPKNSPELKHSQTCSTRKVEKHTSRWKMDLGPSSKSKRDSPKAAQSHLSSLP